ncbi:MAG: arabinan endo-1,5-alpha-L-arabinosidase [Sedimentisphaerales bacterium]|nr:arabinan endo-1,5-alpha-L-arabinosidase [Sedimentisphaerales bacterium]
MNRKLSILTAFFSLLVFSTVPAEAEYEELTGSYSVHDPVMARHDDTYYVFYTGHRTPFRISKDMHHWQSGGYVWPSGPPAWTWEQVPYFDGNIWAPDISFFNGKYHLYYSISSFGKNNSRIGLATNTTLDPCEPDYQWIDSGGPVIRSRSSDSYNAIDPALFIDEREPETTYWLTFGSFWKGIKITQIDPNTGCPFTDPPKLYSIATRIEPPNAIEAPFIVLRNGYYYLFASFDYCCQGTASTYNVRFGRAERVTGPYIDRDGISMTEGGGTQLTRPDDRWKGPGHQAVFQDNNGKDWLIHHAYDASNNGRAYLRIHRLFWTPDGWPSLNEPNCADVYNLGYGLAADFAPDCYIDFHDLAFLAKSWLIDYHWEGLAVLAEQWLLCNNPADPNCTPNW